MVDKCGLLLLDSSGDNKGYMAVNDYNFNCGKILASDQNRAKTILITYLNFKSASKADVENMQKEKFKLRCLVQDIS